MQRWFIGLAACGVSCMLVNGVSAQIEIKIQAQAQAQPVQVQVIQGRAMAVPSYGTSNRLAQSDAVFVGRVVAFEPMDVEAAPVKGQPKVNYRVAVIQLTEAIHGLKKDAKMVRVGFVVGAVQPGVVGGGIQIQGGGFQPLPGGGLGARRVFNPAMTLEVGQDGLFFLAKHPEETFYLGPTFTNFVTRQDNPAFEAEVTSAKLLGKVLADPLAALKSQEKEDRYTAAAVLISRYRPASGFTMPVKEVPIDAAESKQILKALAEGDWTVGRFNATIPGPFELFSQLGIGANDGYQVVNANQQIMSQSMQNWLKDNSEKYVIKKLVADPNGKVLVQPLPQPGALGGIGIRAVQPAQILPVPVPKNDK